MSNFIIPMIRTFISDEKWTFNISENACRKISSLCQMEKEKNPDSHPYLKIAVNSGGCSGFQYEIDLQTLHQEDILYFAVEDFQISVGIDSLSLGFLSGSCLDYEETMMNSSFVIKNPNAQSSCGCGSSFSVF